MLAALVIKQGNSCIRKYAAGKPRCNGYKKVTKIIDKSSFGKKVTNEDLIGEYNSQSENLNIITGVFGKGQNELVDKLHWGINNSVNDVFVILKGKKIKPVEKSFEDARGLVISDYQEYLEKQWIDNLRNEYNIHVHNEVLSSIK